MRTKKRVPQDLNHINPMVHYGELAIQRYERYKIEDWKEDTDVLKDALAQCLVQVGDRLSNKHLSQEVRTQFTFSWKQVRDDFKNFNTHEYDKQIVSEIFESIE